MAHEHQRLCVRLPQVVLVSLSCCLLEFKVSLTALYLRAFAYFNKKKESLEN